MGCGNTKLTETTHSKNDATNKDEKLHENNGECKLNIEELEQIQHQKINTKEKNYLKLANEARESSELFWNNLSLDKQSFFDLLNELEKNENLTSFHMENVLIESVADKVILLARVLMKKNKLKIFKLVSLNNLGRKLGFSIAKVMEGCKLVEKLVIKDLEIEEDDSKLIRLIIENLSQNLIYFEMSLIFFRSKQRQFLEGFCSNNKIQELVLQKISLKEDDFIYLIEALSTNRSLKRLDVSYNVVNFGTRVFKDVKLKNLEILQMNYCSIEDDSFLVLLEGLEFYTTILILELNNNSITKCSAKYVGEYFEKNKTIQNLYLLHNELCKRDVSSLLSSDNLIKIISEI